MMKILKTSVLIIVVFFCHPRTLFADIVTLKSGTVLEGKITSQNERDITLKTNIRSHRISLSDVQKIEKLPLPQKSVDGYRKSKESGLKSSRDIKNKVEFFMTSWCPYCRKMEAFLNENNIPYIKYDIENDPKGNQKYSQLGVRGVPVVLVNGKIVRGYRPDEVLAALNP